MPTFPPVLPDDLDSNARLKVRVGSDEALRRILRVIAGSNVTLGLVDDSVNEEAELTITGPDLSNFLESGDAAGGDLAGTYPNPTVVEANVDHNSLANLTTGDPHTQYLLESALVFSDWTPVLTAVTTNPTLGTGGTATGRLFQLGDFVMADFQLVFGTSPTEGAGEYRVSLPVTMAAGRKAVGSGNYVDINNPANDFPFTAEAISTTQAKLVFSSAALSGAVDPAAFAIQAGDRIQGFFVYEAA